MIRLYTQLGVQQIDLVKRESSFEEWAELRQSVAKALLEQGHFKAIEALEQVHFEIWRGTNVFADEFFLLYAAVPLQEYEKYDKLKTDNDTQAAFKQVADTLRLAKRSVRFIVIDVATEERYSAVPSPSPQTKGGSVERALLDAVHLMNTSGPASAIDRIHTALHAYLQAIAVTLGITVEQDIGVTQLFKCIRNQHPALRQPEIGRILTAMANIVDTVNMVRNNSSLAHPTSNLLDDPEALLVIYSARSIIHYLDARIGALSQ